MDKAYQLSGADLGRLIRVRHSQAPGGPEDMLQGTLEAVRHRRLEDGTVETTLRMTVGGGPVRAVVPGDFTAYSLR